MTTWTALWTMWIVFFFAIEGPALVNKQAGDTLSEHLWAWFAMRDTASRQWRLRRFALVATLAWISAHLLSGGRF